MKHHSRKPDFSTGSGARSQPSVDRKTLQLCSQVRRVLEYGVDEVLHGEALVAVTDVIPAPDASHLLVLVQPMGDTTIEETEAIQQRLVASATQLAPWSPRESPDAKRRRCHSKSSRPSS